MARNDVCEAGPIDEKVSRRQVYSAGFDNNVTVARMAQMGQNSLPDEWVSYNSTLCQVTIPNLHQGKNDVVRWQSNDKNMVNFSVNRAWKDLSGQYEKVPWYIVVWFSNMIPRHAFIVWLLMLGRLPTCKRR
ncbi:RNA-directed DNA polymerase, eukaryota, reverse transcriptase zinc-binding domain protein [Tanacetum coccineum]